MKRLAFFSFVVALFMAASCQNSSDKNTVADFSEPELLTLSDSIAIDEILSPNGWQITDDKVVILSPKTEDQFFVYRLPEFEYLYSFGPKGEGPDDFGFPLLDSYDSRQTPLPIHDLRARKTYLYDIGDTQAEKTGAYDNPITAPLHMYDSLFFRIKMQPHTHPDDPLVQHLVTFNGQGHILDSVQALTFSCKTSITLPGGRTVMGQMLLNHPLATYRDGRLFVRHNAIPRTDLYDITPDGKMRLVRSLGDLSTYEQIQDIGLEKLPERDVVSKLHGSEKYVYAFIFTVKDQTGDRQIVNPRIEVYDWEGAPVKAFTLDRYFSSTLIDEAHGKIFCFDPSLDFEQVFVYDYSL